MAAKERQGIHYGPEGTIYRHDRKDSSDVSAGPDDEIFGTTFKQIPKEIPVTRGVVERRLRSRIQKMRIFVRALLRQYVSPHAAICAGRAPRRKIRHHHSKQRKDQIRRRWLETPAMCSSTTRLTKSGLMKSADARS